MKIKLSRMLVLTLVTLPALAFVGCSDERSESTLNDVVIPGVPGGANKLLWVDADKLTRGNCTTGASFTRANCQGAVVAKPLAESQTRAETLIAQTLTSLTTQQNNEIARIKGADPQVISLNTQIATITKEKTDLERTIAASNQQKTAHTQEQTTKQASLADYEAQIAAVNKQLEADPANRDLLVLREQLMVERDAITARLAFLAAEIADLNKKLALDQAGLTDAVKDLQELQAELKATMDAIVARSPALDQIKAQIAHHSGVKARIPAVINLLKAGDIVYRDNLLNATDREALKYLDNSLGGGSAILRAGRYTGNAGSYCPQKAVAVEEGGVLKTVNITVLSPCSNQTFPMACKEAVCDGKLGSYGYRLVVKTTETYDFSNADGTNKALFTRQGDAE